MKQEDIIKIAEKHGGSMIYVWGSMPRVDNLDLMAYTQAILNALTEEHNAEVYDGIGLRDGGQDDSTRAVEGDGTGGVRGEPAEVQLEQKGRKKANTTAKKGVQESATTLREGS